MNADIVVVDVKCPHMFLAGETLRSVIYDAIATRPNARCSTSMWTAVRWAPKAMC